MTTPDIEPSGRPEREPVMREIRPRRRRSRRFRPHVDLAGGGSAPLELRLLLNAAPMAAHHPHRAHHAAHPKGSGRVTPAQEINKQYNQFYAAFQQVEADYVGSLNQQSSNTVNVTTTVTANYSAGSATMQVADAGVFGTQGTYSSPVTATAFVGSVPVGTFTFSGSSGNQLIVSGSNPAGLAVNSGTTLNGQATATAASSAQSIFPTYITISTQQLAVNLVAYFNSLPFKLPRMYAPPHQSQRSGAIQQYVYQLVAGGQATSLQRTLSTISLPATPGSDLQIYDAAVKMALDASKTQMLSGVQQIFAGKLPVVPINGSSSSNSGTTSGSSSTASGSSSTTSGSGSTASGSGSTASTGG